MRRDSVHDWIASGTVEHELHRFRHEPPPPPWPTQVVTEVDDVWLRAPPPDGTYHGLIMTQRHPWTWDVGVRHCSIVHCCRPGVSGG
ncbi:hypothetical protein MGALJ_27480 [Mycobacterium gallinarum]|uniref:Uncharacterized protein n=1 Tax=Mycobacterium gallinarum TaxID=39689 RepID=A0A9W4B332_9MYCO|nr:hypothetical protein MGALJ_27480 [Mycobacterium gallinarum]